MESHGSRLHFNYKTKGGLKSVEILTSMRKESYKFYKKK